MEYLLESATNISTNYLRIDIMPEKNIYIISTGALFGALNNNRKNHGLAEIENSLIASKLGILFALKTNSFINFRGENVKLDDTQLVALREILDQHFNAEMIGEIRNLVLAQEQLQKKMLSSSQVLNAADSIYFISKIKGFLKVKTQGIPA